LNGSTEAGTNAYFFGIGLEIISDPKFFRSWKKGLSLFAKMLGMLNNQFSLTYRSLNCLKQVRPERGLIPDSRYPSAKSEVNTLRKFDSGDSVYPLKNKAEHYWSCVAARLKRYFLWKRGPPVAGRQEEILHFQVDPVSLPGDVH
jgi:hypothetical protein